MNAALVAAPCAFLVGVVAGGLATSVTPHWRQRRERPGNRDIDNEALTDVDRDEIAAQFTSNVLAVRHSIGEYADALAGDDERLRTLLHRLERGARS